MAVGSTALQSVDVDPTTVQVIYGVSSLTAVLLSYVIWQHRQKTGAVALLVAFVGGWWWSTALFLATLTGDYELSLLLQRSIYFGVVVAVAGIFLFALAYTGREHLVNRRVVALLSIEPVVVIVLAFANPGNVFFESIMPDPASAVGVSVDFGVAFHLHALYSYVLVFAVAALVLGLVYRTRAMYRGQLVVLIGAVLLPLGPNMASIAGVFTFDATPVGFILANALYTLAIVRYRLIDLAPIARDRVVNNVNDAMYVVDTDHRMVDVNPAGEDLAAEFVGDVALVGEDARDVLEPVPELESLYESIVSEETAQTIEYEIDGGYYSAEATPIRDSRDRFVGWLFLVRDVTERKLREQELRERNEKLDAFASVVSHDLRNPLQVASGRVELARRTGDTEHLADVDAALERMGVIIDDVLSLARGGDTVTDMGPVDVRSAAEEAWGNVDTTGASLRVRTDARIEVDRDRFVRLLENLFRNAVEHGSTSHRSQAVEDAAEHGTDGQAQANEAAAVEADTERDRVRETADLGVADERLPGHTEVTPTLVTVEVGLVRDGEDAVGVYVADDGPGIPESVREQIFESGYSTDPEGTGFGLTIVSQIAAAHGWEVDVTESDDGGARFELAGVEVVGT